MFGAHFKTLSLAALVAVAAVQVADAHGPTRKKIEETITINASPDKVWKVMGNFQDMSWLPPVKSTKGSDGNTPDKAKRTLDLGNGATIDEALGKYDAADHTYSYRIEKVDVKVLPVNDYSSTIKVEPEDGGKSSKVTWKGAFYRGYMNNDPPPELNDEASMAAVRKVYKAGLDNLKKKVEGAS